LRKEFDFAQRISSSFIKDARILYEAGSYGHAQALAILAMEEYAKKIVLIAKKMYRDRFDDEIGRSFKDHDFKLQLALDMLMREFPDAPLVSKQRG